MTSVTKRGWQALADSLRVAGERRLVLVEGEPEWCRSWVSGCLETLEASLALWVGRAEDAELAGVTGIASKQFKRWLGRETSVLVWDGWQGNPPDGLAALSGTLQAGGVLFWLMPPLQSWATFNDPDYVRTGLDQAERHAFAARMAGVLAADSDVIRVRQGREDSLILPVVESGSLVFEPATTAEQAQLVSQLVRFGLGRRRRPLVVTADRGRGKSAALGMAAAELLLAGRQRVLVTSPSVDNLASFFRHAAETLGERLAERRDDALVMEGGSSIRYLAVQDLLAEKPDAEVVMVDEAAGVPAHWLREVLLGWPRVAFASTVHGYEGTGRGFAIRFRQVLDRETPHWRSISLNQPVRWAAGDPLERLVSELFLLSAESLKPASPAAGDVVIERWHPAKAGEQELSEAFGLLVDAHYRTTPVDLRQWLDDPGVQSWRAVVNGATVGVLWASVEGGLAPELAEQVAQGVRRPRGHMLAQSLATHGGFPEAAIQRTLRVVRVAVSQECRQLGIGKQLVTAAAQACAEQGLDGLGTSFGGEPGLLAFWRACGLRVVRLGLRQETSTGEFPVQMLCGLSDSGKQLAQGLRERFAKHWPVLIPRHWAGLAPELVAAVGADLPACARLDAGDRRELVNFSEGFRGFDLTLPVLRQVERCPGVTAWLAVRPELIVWCRAVSQGWTWDEIRLSGMCAGQKDGEMQLRNLVRELLKNGPEL
ncbi:tRNA(Met) cytidine acetyltransferase TmcA [Marinobacter litoralis]|uniref:tRNA(Met) cytidine acetyltransferase TmcA n=1 Tax=Marinobacter litoralis TaxID=187981 RepID=UPI0018ED7AF5|nr:GNAT family N-acetyltransferase [Marinobacter litoralis]MBJ6136562.1 tRNA(Met) cytidine acetyltransferase [Marinobacter litoralis]